MADEADDEPEAVEKAAIGSVRLPHIFFHVKFLCLAQEDEGPANKLSDSFAIR